MKSSGFTEPRSRLSAVLEALRTRLPAFHAYLRFASETLSRRRWQPPVPLPSFAQFGEDRLAAFLLEHIGVHAPAYLDIGASAPYYLSNTAMFYLKGCRGVVVDPREETARAFGRRRPGDICIQAGVAPSDREATFYEFATPEFCTFDAQQAAQCEGLGHKVLSRSLLPLLTVKTILEDYAGGRMPDLLSVDVEGWELPILQSIEFDKHRPKVIIAEVINSGSSKGFTKNYEIAAFLGEKRYRVVADTFVNIIAVDMNVFADVPPLLPK